MFHKLSSQFRAFVAAVAVSFFLVAPAVAAGSGSADPTASLISSLATFEGDVALIAGAVLAIFYLKKMVLAYKLSGR